MINNNSYTSLKCFSMGHVKLQNNYTEQYHIYICNNVQIRNKKWERTMVEVDCSLFISCLV